MALGVPAKIRPDAVRPGSFDDAVRRYVANGARYAKELRRIDDPVLRPHPTPKAQRAKESAATP
jgi:hypothetical protein